MLMISKQDKRLYALAGVLFLAPHIFSGCVDAAAAECEWVRNAQPLDKPIIAAIQAEQRDNQGEDPDEDAKITAALVDQGYFREDVPLDYELQDVLHTACTRYGVDYSTVLGLIEVESNFDTEAVNPVSGCYGLMQLNPVWFPSGLSPAENIEVGIAYLGALLEQYSGNLPTALTAYNAGRDTGRREYANAVLAAAEGWEE